MADGWYYRKNTGEVRGPFTGKQLREQAGSMELTPEDRVRKGTEGKWAFARQVSGLFPQASSASGQSSPAKAPQAKVRQRLSSSSIKVRSPRDDADTKKCPYCAEEIKAAARKCKHCGEMLDDMEPSLAHDANTSKQPGYGKRFGLIGGLVAGGVFVLLGVLVVAILNFQSILQSNIEEHENKKWLEESDKRAAANVLKLEGMAAALTEKYGLAVKRGSVTRKRKHNVASKPSKPNVLNVTYPIGELVMLGNKIKVSVGSESNGKPLYTQIYVMDEFNINFFP